MLYFASIIGYLYNRGNFIKSALSMTYITYGLIVNLITFILLVYPFKESNYSKVENEIINFIQQECHAKVFISLDYFGVTFFEPLLGKGDYEQLVYFILPQKDKKEIAKNLLHPNACIIINSRLYYGIEWFDQDEFYNNLKATREILAEEFDLVKTFSTLVYENDSHYPRVHNGRFMKNYPYGADYIRIGGKEEVFFFKRKEVK